MTTHAQETRKLFVSQGNYYECLGCGSMIDNDICPEDLVPDVSFPDTWAEIAKHHGNNCEWIVSRAYQRLDVLA